jgi:CHAT domain-containing protein
VQLQEKQRLYGAHWTSPLMSPTVDPSFIQASLTDDDALLTFQVCDEGFIVFVMTRDSLHFENVPYPRQKLASDVQRVCEGFGVLEGRSLARLDNPILRREWWSRRPGEKHPEDIEKPLQQLLSELEKVFAILIAPVLSLAHAKPHWVIVPHGVLHRVPWAALWTGSHYLIEEHSVGLLPSASFGTALRQRDQSSGNEVLLMGAPDPIHDSLGLPGAAAELRAAQKALGVTGQPRVAADATKETFLKEGGSARLIHVAAHHFFDGSAPGLSFLKLAGDTGARFLYANEVAELRLGAQLVVLSACETARSHVVAGDEQYGMIRSFLAAGARSIVSTLWAIEDESAAQIFSLFYQNATRRPLAQALANAQRGMMKTPPYDLPYFWAPYVLSGEWDRPLSMKPS